MKSTSHRIRRGVFGAAVAAALAFGSAQAFASPVRADVPPTCDELCNRACRAAGLIGGFCSGDIGCSCYI